MLAALKEAKVPLKAIKQNPERTQPITQALQALLSKSQDLKVRELFTPKPLNLWAAKALLSFKAMTSRCGNNPNLSPLSPDPNIV